MDRLTSVLISVDIGRGVTGLNRLNEAALSSLSDRQEQRPTIVDLQTYPSTLQTNGH